MLHTLDLATSIGRLPRKIVRLSRSAGVSFGGTYFEVDVGTLTLLVDPALRDSCTSSSSSASASEASHTSRSVACAGATVDGPGTSLSLESLGAGGTSRFRFCLSFDADFARSFDVYAISTGALIDTGTCKSARAYAALSCFYEHAVQRRLGKAYPFTEHIVKVCILPFAEQREAPGCRWCSVRFLLLLLPLLRL